MSITTGTQYTPAFTLVVNQKDVTTAVLDRLVSLTVKKFSKGESASLSLEIADTDPLNRIAAPQNDDQIHLHMGYADNITDMGTFVIDSVTLGGGADKADTMQIEAKGINTSSKMFDRKYKIWKSEEKGKPLMLGDIIKKIATGHGLTGKVSPVLATVEVQREIQRRESDISFLRYLAEKHQAVVSFYKKNLALVHLNTATVSGAPIPPQIISPTLIKSWNVTFGNRWDFKKIKAEWWDADEAGLKVAETVNSNADAGIDKEYTIKSIAGSEKEAMRLALAEKKRLSDQCNMLTIDMIGNANIYPLTPVVIAGVRNHVDGTWMVGDVSHNLSSSGFTTNLSNMSSL